MHRCPPALRRLIHDASLPPTAARLGPLLLATLLWLSLPGCALRLIAPTPDVGELKPVRVGPRRSQVALVARLSHAQLGALVDTLKVAPIDVGQRVRFAGWGLHIERRGKVHIHTENERLCVTMPFEGLGSIELVGKTAKRRLRADLHACAEPEFRAGAVLALVRPTFQVKLEQGMIAGMNQVLYDALEHQLRETVSPQLRAAITTLRVPLRGPLTPLLKALDSPLPLDRGACLKLRPERLRLGAPEIDPTQVRISASLVGQPTIERPCAPPQPPAPAKIALETVDALRHPQTELLLPVGVAISELRGPLLSAIRKAGKIQHEGGWLEITDLKLQTAQGAVLIRAAVRGQTRAHFLGMIWNREVKGAITLWGLPSLGAESVGLQKISLLVDTDDLTTDLVASLRRAKLRETVAQHLRWPRKKLRAEAAKLLAKLSTPLKVGDQQLPLRVDTQDLRLHSIRAKAGRLEILVRYRGHIVIGSTRRR